MVKLDEWVNTVSYTPMLRFSLLAPMLSEYFPDGVGLSPATIRHSGTNRKRGGGAKTVKKEKSPGEEPVTGEGVAAAVGSEGGREGSVKEEGAAVPVARVGEEKPVEGREGESERGSSVTSSEGPKKPSSTEKSAGDKNSKNLSLSLTHTHTYTHTFSLAHSLFHSLSLCYSLTAVISHTILHPLHPFHHPQEGPRAQVGEREGEKVHV